MANVAETLRAEAREIQESIDSIVGELENDPRPSWREAKAACESGARAWEIVQQLANARQGGGYHDCGDVDDIMLQARSLVTGQE